MPTDKFANLAQRREPMSPDDRAALREKAMLLSVIGGAISLGFFYFVFSNVKEIFDTIQYSLPRTLFFWGKLFITIGFTFVVIILGRTIRRSWQAVKLDQKIVYSGRVTGKRKERGSKQVSHFASLDGVEFSLDGEEFQKISDGDFAELHCAFPGEVFRASKADAPTRGKQKKTNNLEVTIDGNTFTVDLNKSPIARIGIFLGGIVLAVIFASASLGMWWFGSHPPAALLFRGTAVEMQITEARVESSPYKTGKWYQDIVLISPVQVEDTPDDEDEEIPARKNFSLEARPEASPGQNEAAAKKALQNYSIGKKITAYTFDKKTGPYYALRYSFRSLASMISGVLGALAIAVIAGYFAFRRRENE